MPEAVDVSTAQLTLAFVGTVTVPALLFLFIEALKDWFPSIQGRAALGVVYGLSAAIAGALLYANGANWTDPLTYLAALIIAINIAIVAKGIFATVFQRRVDAARVLSALERLAVAPVPQPPDAVVPVAGTTASVLETAPEQVAPAARRIVKTAEAAR